MNADKRGCGGAADGVCFCDEERWMPDFIQIHGSVFISLLIYFSADAVNSPPSASSFPLCM